MAEIFDLVIKDVRVVRATASGVARSPRRAAAGPPGSERTQANSRIVRPNRVGTRSKILLPMVRSTVLLR